MVQNKTVPALDNTVLREYCRAFEIKTEVDDEGNIKAITGVNGQHPYNMMPVAILGQKSSYIGFHEGYTGVKVCDSFTCSDESRAKQIVAAYIEGYKAGEKMRERSQ